MFGQYFLTLHYTHLYFNYFFSITGGNLFSSNKSFVMGYKQTPETPCLNFTPIFSSVFSVFKRLEREKWDNNPLHICCFSFPTHLEFSVIEEEPHSQLSAKYFYNLFMKNILMSFHLCVSFSSHSAISFTFRIVYSDFKVQANITPLICS